MLFLGLGTGLGSAFVADGQLEPLELAHLPYRNNRTYEDYVGLRGFKRMGRQKWQRHVEKVVELLKHGLQADYVMLGGGQTKKLKGDAAGRAPRQQRARHPGRHPSLGHRDLRATTRRRRSRPRPPVASPAARPRRLRRRSPSHVHPSLPGPPRRHPAHGGRPLLGSRSASTCPTRDAEQVRPPGRAPGRRPDQGRLLQPALPHGGDGRHPGRAAPPDARRSATACARSATAAGKG